MSTIAEPRAYPTDAVANEFLSLPNATGCISPMKLQKLVYYAHGWHLALRDKPLVKEKVQAWRYGPVFPTLYAEFRDFGKDPITRLAFEAKVARQEGGGFTVRRYAPRLPNDDSWSKELIAKVWSQIGTYTAGQLSTMTHQSGTPWHQVASGFGQDPPRAVAIPNKLIRDYFREKLEDRTSDV